MRYARIDTTLMPWAKRRGLFVATQYKDEEVRSIQIVDDAGECYGLWLGVPAGDSVSVSITDHAGPSRQIRRQTFTSSITDLTQTLESAYAVVDSWIRERGHTRTPVV